MAVIELKSEVAGIIWKIEARVGQRVTCDDAVLLVESMKMEIPVFAPRDSTVLEILVNETDPVREGTVVALLQAE